MMPWRFSQAGRLRHNTDRLMDCEQQGVAGLGQALNSEFGRARSAHSFCGAGDSPASKNLAVMMSWRFSQAGRLRHNTDRLMDCALQDVAGLGGSTEF